jgi:hypothetical protein
MLRSGVTFVLLLAAPFASPASKAEAVRVTTDSVVYCFELAGRVERHQGAANERTRNLTLERKALCANGQVRSGIGKLRRALREAQAGG